MDCQVIEKRAQELLVEPVEKMGYEVVEIKCSTENKNETHLTIFIFSCDGITIDDCVKVNDVLNPILDNNDISDGKPYFLNISSPGLDRQINTDDDFRRNLGEKVDLKVQQPGLKGSMFVGTIDSYDEESFMLTTAKGKSIKILRKNIKSLLLHIDFGKIKKIKNI